MLLATSRQHHPCPRRPAQLGPCAHPLTFACVPTRLNTGNVQGQDCVDYDVGFQGTFWTGPGLGNWGRPADGSAFLAGQSDPKSYCQGKIGGSQTFSERFDKWSVKGEALRASVQLNFSAFPPDATFWDYYIGASCALHGVYADHCTPTEFSVTLTVTASGSVEQYADTSALQQSVATAAGVDAVWVVIEVAGKAASVIVTATITVPQGSTTVGVAEVLFTSLGTTAATATAALGIAVQSVPTVLVSALPAAPPAPPSAPPLPSSPPAPATPPQPPSQPTSASGAFTTEAIIGVVVGSVVVLIAGGGVFWCASSFFTMPACPPRRPPAPGATPRRHSACVLTSAPACYPCCASGS